MKTFKVNGKNGSYAINLPQSLEELGTEYLSKCTDFINPAPNYAVVAVVYKDLLSLVLTVAKKKNPVNAAVIPVFVKAGDSDSEFIKSIKLGDRVVVSGSDLSIGHHIKSPYNKITPSNIMIICDGDKDIYRDSMTMKEPVCFVEFKLVPISAIHAKLNDTPKGYVNPFIKGYSNSFISNYGKTDIEN